MNAFFRVIRDSTSKNAGKKSVISITIDGGANVVAAVRLFLADNHRIPCMAHCLNLVVQTMCGEIKEFSTVLKEL